jgi:hypothetical protein
MTDQEIGTVHCRLVHAIDEFMFRRSIEINHDIPAPNTIEFFLEGERFVHQVEFSIGDFFFELIDHRIAVRYFSEIFVQNCRGHALEPGCSINTFNRRRQCFFGNIGRQKPTVPILVVGTKNTGGVLELLN